MRDKKIAFEPRLYPYQDHGGTAWAAALLGVPENAVIKTLVMEAEDGHAFIVLMHGDCDVSTKQLARELGHKRISPAGEATAQKHTGYQIGGISPFGTRSKMQVFAEASIFNLPKIYINGGKRGFLVEMNPADLHSALGVTAVNAAIPR